MTRLSLLGIAALAATTAFAVPAFAQHRMMHPYAQAADSCANYDPGNPYNKETDFWSWSAWRSRGGWDDRADIQCVPTPSRPSAY